MEISRNQKKKNILSVFESTCLIAEWIRNWPRFHRIHRGYQPTSGCACVVGAVFPHAADAGLRQYVWYAGRRGHLYRRHESHQKLKKRRRCW